MTKSSFLRLNFLFFSIFLLRVLRAFVVELLACLTCRTGQQQTGFGVGDAVDLADAAKDGIETFQIGRGEFDDHVPAAVGGVDDGDFGESTQGAEDRGGAVAADFDHHDGAHALGAGVGAETEGETLDGASGEQALDAVLHRAAGDGQAGGEAGDGAAGILAQKGDEGAIGVVHLQGDCRFAREGWHYDRSGGGTKQFCGFCLTGDWRSVRAPIFAWMTPDGPDDRPLTA